MKRNKRGSYLMRLGLLLLAAALLLTGYNLWDEHRAQQAVQAVLAQMPQTVTQPQKPSETVIPDHILNPEAEMPALEIDGALYLGVLDIPALGLSLPVMRQWSYPNLKIAPCRYAGSVYTDTMVIAAHNYRAHFGGLKNLPQGAQVIFTDADGSQFHYQLTALEVLAPTAIEEMTESDWDLTLFTCTYGGQTRLAARCTAAEPAG